MNVDPLDESGVHTNMELLEAAMTREGAALVLRGLVEREAYWRERLGEDYELAVGFWRKMYFRMTPEP